MTDNQLNNEDMHDYRTVALAAARFATVGENADRYLFSINLKHKMVTFPIGKCRPNEGLLDGLVREMQEELGLFLQTEHLSKKPYCTFTKPYWFTGQLVKVETNVFCAAGPYGKWICSNSKNNEPEKCGGIFLATIDDAINIAKTTGLLIADCVMYFRQCRMDK